LSVKKKLCRVAGEGLSTVLTMAIFYFSQELGCRESKGDATEG